jgi:hypothetical protein
VRSAQENNLARAESTLASALGCPGSSPLRELAGVRALQKRWLEAADLAAGAVAEDRSDTYAWTLLATARFVTGSSAAALEAWNRAGEPRLDLVRVEGLTHTRQAAIEELIGLERGALITPATLVRARRRLAELPSAFSTSLDYVPRGQGLADARVAIAERPRVPWGPLTAASVGVSAAVNRTMAISFGSLSGGGERWTIAWRFWERRARYSVDVNAPGPWGGVWGVSSESSRQSFTRGILATRRESGELSFSRWASGRLRWEAGAGLARWHERGLFGAIRAGTRLVSLDGRFAAGAGVRSWVGDAPFSSVNLLAMASTSTAQQGTVFTARSGFGVVGREAPTDAWLAGDVGHAMPTLLRAHPVLDDGRIRAERLGRALVSGSVEAQHWWRVGPVRLAGASFLDAARTSRRLSGGPLADVDAGAGLRLAAPVVPGTLRIDYAIALRGTGSALSCVLVLE